MPDRGALRPIDIPLSHSRGIGQKGSGIWMEREPHPYDLAACSVEQLLALFVQDAMRKHDGHFTILGFTRGVKAAFGTPNLGAERYDPYDPACEPGHELVGRLHVFPTLREALLDALARGTTLGRPWRGEEY
jgi:hypothetical protein